MAKMPDGWVMIPKYEGINQDENGKLAQQFSIADKELVMCKNCKHGICQKCYEVLEGEWRGDDWYCADGERRESE